MKIGIVTFWDSLDNYGSILQAYALQAYLNRQGYDAFVIRHKDKSSFLHKLLRFLLRGRWIYYFKRHFEFKDCQEKAQVRQFDAFRRRYVKMSEHEYHSLDEIQKNPPVADIYIAGSDCIWQWLCPLFDTSYSNIYCLNFGSNNVKRISYAPSFCGETIFPADMALFHKLVSRFAKVSVREKDGIQICAAADIKAVQCVDPTLLLDADVYKGMMAKRKHKGDYAYFYTVNVVSEEEIFWRELRDHFTSKDVESIVTTGSGEITAKEIFEGAIYDYATVEEWLSNMYYANLVFCSSFHGVVFSIIFHKNFVFLPQKGKLETRNSRASNILDLCGLRDRVAVSAGDAIRLADTAIDYAHLKDEPLKELVNFSKGFLRLE